MNTIFTEMDRALSFGMFYLAIVLALTIPDICTALESPNGRATEKGYRNWCKRWFLVRGYNRHLTDADLWRLRSGLVHQGRMGHPGMEFSRVIFTLPNPVVWIDLCWMPDPKFPNDKRKRVLSLDA